MKVGNHNYFLSWREPWHKFEVSHIIKVQLVQDLFTSFFFLHALFSGLGLVQRAKLLQGPLHGSGLV